MPGVRLHVIGSTDTDATALWSRDDVLLHGRVADLAPWLESCRLSIAPLRFGAGVKGKLNTAMAHGLPVVATLVAAEAMHLQDGRDVLLADDAESFAAAIVRVYGDAELWGALSAGGLANVRNHFSETQACAVLRELLGAARVGSDSY